MKEGYWLKGNKAFQVTDHARWLIDHDHYLEFDPINDRIEILLRAMKDGYIRVRAHGISITFEFSIETDTALLDVHNFLKRTQLAGPHTALTLSNLRTKEVTEISYADFVQKMKEEGPSSLLREKMQLNYTTKMIERIERKITDG
jgi:DNA topoisomerase VI subunit B